MMLKAIQKQLNSLARDEDHSFENHIKNRWKGKLPKGLVEDMKSFVKLLPKIERRISSLYVWLPDSSQVKGVGSHFLTYMYQPDDFLPENEANGLFGYLDDAYLAALFYELMLEEIEASKNFRLYKQDKELLHKVIKLRKRAKSVIPDEAIKIKQMVGELFEGDETTYQNLFKERVSA